jgi:hypothetical protein
MTGLRQLVVGVLIVGTALGLSFSAGAAGPDAPESDRELVLGLRAAPPFAMKSADGIWTGITVELWRHMAEQLGHRYRFEETTGEELFQGLVAGRLDASAGALTVTGERLREVDFSLPYLVTGLGVAVPRQAPLNWLGIAASFLTLRFLSIVVGILGLLMLVSLILWLLERRHTEYFGGPAVDGLICSVTWSAQGDVEGQPPIPITDDKIRTSDGCCMDHRGRGIDRDVHRGGHKSSDSTGTVGIGARRSRPPPRPRRDCGRCGLRQLSGPRGDPSRGLRDDRGRATSAGS